MFVLDFSPHLPKKTYPVRNVRIGPDAGTLAATFGKEGRAEHAAWWSLTDGKLIGTSSILSPNLDQGDTDTFVEPVFTPDLARCAIHEFAPGSGSVEFHSVAVVAPSISYEQAFALAPCEDLWEGGLQATAITPDGRYLLAGHGQGMLSRWDLRKVKLNRHHRRPVVYKNDEEDEGFESEEMYQGESIFLGEEGDIDEDESAMVFSPDGKRIAYALSSGEVRLYNWRSRRQTAALNLPVPVKRGGQIRAMAFAPNGESLAVRVPGRMTVFDLAEESVATQLDLADLSDMAFTPDGKRLLTGGSDKLVRVWDTVTWQEIARFDWKIGAIHSVTVSADGAIAAAGGDKCRVVVWDLEE